MVQDQAIKDFYSQLEFPGRYTQQDLDRYDHRPNNRYLSFIYDHLAHGQEVLDAGCGTGLITNLFASRFHSQFYAVDFADSIQYGRQFAQDHKIINTHWQQQDLTQLEPVRKFDRIICQGVLHHIPRYHQVLDVLKQSLRPQGILLLGLYNPWGKIKKKLASVHYHSRLLYHDQERNPFELAFSVQQVLDLCQDMEFLSATPWYHNKYVTNYMSFFNSANGGLILYAFRST